ncbi:unnamed protein product [Paramecium sonneborni]|uniref:Uncharacterized protein n=1 Tax=Paramecium sonneborni TaxID=65129 RepID=A0A8S1R119_9CILI|nr:unnamed protein product [Paramecium sonneborni]
MDNGKMVETQYKEGFLFGFKMGQYIYQKPSQQNCFRFYINIIKYGYLESPNQEIRKICPIDLQDSVIKNTSQSLGNRQFKVIYQIPVFNYSLIHKVKQKNQNLYILGFNLRQMSQILIFIYSDDKICKVSYIFWNKFCYDYLDLNFLQIVTFFQLMDYDKINIIKQKLFLFLQQSKKIYYLYMGQTKDFNLILNIIQNIYLNPPHYYYAIKNKTTEQQISIIFFLKNLKIFLLKGFAWLSSIFKFFKRLQYQKQPLSPFNYLTIKFGLQQKQLIQYLFLLKMFQYFIIGFLYCLTCQEVFVYEFDSNNGQIEDWVFSNQYSWTQFSSCMDFQLLGGFNILQRDYISRIFLNLESHYRIKIQIEFLIVDRIDYSPFNIYLDSSEINNFNFQTSLVSQCGDPSSDDLVQVMTFDILHKRKTAWIQIQQNNYLHWVKCEYQCVICTEVCLKWKPHQYILTEKTFSTTNQLMPINEFNLQVKRECGLCSRVYSTQIGFKSQLPPHQDVLVIFHNYDITILKVNYKNSIKTISLQNGIVELLFQNHFVEEFQFIVFYQNYNCCPNIRDLEIYYSVIEEIQSQIPECIQQFNSQCINCQEGWIINPIIKKCIPFCGDNKIQGNEECDDGNLYQFDGCFQCQIECVRNCEICKYGICQGCKLGFEFNIDFKCIPKSQEMIIYQPQCTEQIEKTCISCQKGWIINTIINKCFPYCGDNYIQGNEECEDGNLNQFDGCFQCQIECVRNCEICKYGICQGCKLGFEFNIDFKCIPKIQDMEIYQPQCIQQIDNKCISCLKGWIINTIINKCFPFCGDNYIYGNEECDDGNLYQFDGCFQCQIECVRNCEICQNGICKECQFGYTFNENLNCFPQNPEMEIYQPQCIQQINNKCITCQDGWIINSIINKCFPSCGDNYINGNEQCDDGNFNEYDGCFQCQIECVRNCEICQNGICLECKLGFEFDDSLNCFAENKNTQIYQPQCTQEIDKKCITCQKGWVVNPILEKCSSLCGDKQIQGDEECDDGNFKQYDGCFECKFECIQNCQGCKNGICQECKIGFEFDKENEQCLPVCGDGLLIPLSSEFCDDGNKIQGDGCFDCIFECDQFCLNCVYIHCFECQEGFQPLNGVCHPICGDSIVLPDFEECDDGNDISDDGCHLCKRVCGFGCEICQQGKCLINCSQTYGQGYYYIDEICQSKCGDNIVTVEEDCDDGNNIQFDGCFNCQFSCEENCLNCLKGECIQYKPICGNAIIEDQEICDDGNQKPNDGCFNCEIESNWMCKQIENQIICDSPTQFIPNYLSISNNKQLILFNFSTEIKIQTGQNLTQAMILSFMDDQIEYKLTILDKKEPIEDKVQEVFYLIQIEIYETLDSQPILNINLNSTILNRHNVSLEQLQYQLKLQIPQYLEPKQLQAAQTLAAINQYFAFGLLSSGGINLIVGNLQMFTEILDLFQQFAYLRYINLCFPTNLLIYFQIYDLLTVSIISDFINFQQIQDLLIPPQEIQPQFGNFLLYKQNSDLLCNLTAQFLELLVLLLFYISQKLIYKLVFQLIFQRRFFQCKAWLLKKFSLKFTQKLFQFLQKRIRKLLQQSKKSSSQLLISIMIINGWDINFKCFLYLKSLENYSLRSLISSSLAVFIISSYIFFLLQQIFEKKLLNLRKKKEIIEQRYEALNLLRQIIFLFILIFLYVSEIIQLAYLSASALTSIFLIIKMRKILDKDQLIKMILQEGTILVFIISSIIYVKDFDLTFSTKTKISIGFFHIGCFTFMMAFQYVKMVRSFIAQISKMFPKKQKNKKLMTVNLFHIY